MKKDFSETTVNKRVKNIVDALGITQNAFASKIDVAGSVIYNIVNGRNKPSFDILEKIVSLFGVNASYILTGEGDMFSSNDETTISSDTDPIEEDSEYEQFFDNWANIRKIVVATGKRKKSDEYSTISSIFSIISDVIEHYSLLNQSIAFLKFAPKNMDNKIFSAQVKTMLEVEGELYDILKEYIATIAKIYKEVSDFNERHDNIYHVDDDVFDSWFDVEK
jgi:transcriptional regulator with XRE-family HTH domain